MHRIGGPYGLVLFCTLVVSQCKRCAALDAVCTAGNKTIACNVGAGVTTVLQRSVCLVDVRALLIQLVVGRVRGVDWLELEKLC